MSGFEVLRSLRVSKVRTPILILTGLAGIEDKVRGLGFGATNYMTKPFHKDELVARIHAIVSPLQGPCSVGDRVRRSVVNLDTKMAQINGTHVHLTVKEYQILELLSLRMGMTRTKDTVLNHLYGGVDEPEMKIIDVFICKLRKKLPMRLAAKIISNDLGPRLRDARAGASRGQDFRLAFLTSAATHGLSWSWCSAACALSHVSSRRVPARSAELDGLGVMLREVCVVGARRTKCGCFGRLPACPVDNRILTTNARLLAGEAASGDLDRAIQLSQLGNFNHIRASCFWGASLRVRGGDDAKLHGR